MAALLSAAQRGNGSVIKWRDRRRFLLGGHRAAITWEGRLQYNRGVVGMAEGLGLRAIQYIRLAIAWGDTEDGARMELLAYRFIGAAVHTLHNNGRVNFD
jgi:hypothetical protein